jgi:folate-binding protein YgfZ
VTATAEGAWLRAAHARHAAVFAPRAGGELPAWYGTDESAAVAAEYAAAREAAAVVDLAERGLLAVTGALRQKFLHGMVSHDVQGRAAGQGCLASLMDVKGHVQAILRVLITADAVLLELPRERLAAVEATLQHHRVAAPVRFAAPPAAVLGLLGPQAKDVLARAGFALPDLGDEDHATGTLAGHGARAARASDLPCGGCVLHVAPEAAESAWDALTQAGARPLGRGALDALRIEQGLPWYGPDVSEDNLLHETGLVPRLHSPTKGCYLGQEVIARLEARGGNVNKALRGLRLEAPAAPGDVIAVEGHDVGRVTTAAVSPRLGPLAMGYVHRNHFAPSTSVDVAGRPARVTALPLED